MKRASGLLVGERGRVRETEFEWSTSHGTLGAEAVLSLPMTVLDWFDAPIRVAARVIARPEMAGESTLRPRFDCAGTIDLKATSGARGGEAEAGGPGDRGPELEVALTYIETRLRGRLVLVRVQRAGESAEHYLFDPRAPIVIDASGGRGGSGGQGVTGEDGIAGGSGAECEDGMPGQPGGPGGPGASGGDGGDGGRVQLRYDARYPELANHIPVRIDGGEPGEAGTGGIGGRGGRGGNAAGCPDPALPAANAGGFGGDGERGPSGQPGAAGRPGEIVRSPVEVAELFADEIARGLPIETGAAAGASR